MMHFSQSKLCAIASFSGGQSLIALHNSGSIIEFRRLIDSNHSELLYTWDIGEMEGFDVSRSKLRLVPISDHEFYCVLWMVYSDSSTLSPRGKIFYARGAFSALDVPENQDIPALSPTLIAYPNPANQNMHFEAKNLSSKPHQISIYNLKGQLLKTYEIPGSNQAIEIEWNGQDSSGKKLGSGIYFLKLESDNRPILTRKISWIK